MTDFMLDLAGAWLAIWLGVPLIREERAAFLGDLDLPDNYPGPTK